MTCGGFRSTFLSACNKFAKEHEALIYHFTRHKLYTLLWAGLLFIMFNLFNLMEVGFYHIFEHLNVLILSLPMLTEYYYQYYPTIPLMFSSLVFYQFLP